MQNNKRYLNANKNKILKVDLTPQYNENLVKFIRSDFENMIQIMDSQQFGMQVRKKFGLVQRQRL